MEFIRSHKKLLTISGLIVVLLLGTLLLLKHVDNSASAILEARITADDLASRPSMITGKSKKAGPVKTSSLLSRLK